LEALQKMAINIIFPSAKHDASLTSSNTQTLSVRRETLTERFL